MVIHVFHELIKVIRSKQDVRERDRRGNARSYPYACRHTLINHRSFFVCLLHPLSSQKVWTNGMMFRLFFDHRLIVLADCFVSLMTETQLWNAYQQIVRIFLFSFALVFPSSLWLLEPMPSSIDRLVDKLPAFSFCPRFVRSPSPSLWMPNRCSSHCYFRFIYIIY